MANYTEEAMSAADAAYKKIIGFLQKNKNVAGKINKEYFKKFIDHLENNFDTPQAIATIWILLKDSDLTDADKVATILEMDKILGLNLEKVSSEIVEIPKEITTLAEERWQAKLQKNWTKSDEIRGQIEALGYTIKDSGDSYEVIAS